MADKTIKHFVVVRFFPKQNANYPYSIFDVDFLSKQLVLAKNILKSLENQTNINFELFFSLNKKHFSDKKYAFIFSTLRDTTTLPITFVAWRSGKIKSLVQDAYNNYDFVIQSRMDFDDFIYKDAVEDTQNKIAECENVLSYGYCKGYMYFNGDLYSRLALFNEIGHIGIFQSLIMKSSFAKNLPFASAYLGGHHKIKLALKSFLEKNGVEFSENMFQQNTSTNAYIYYRHEFSTDVLAAKRDVVKLIEKRNLAIVEDVTKKQLEEEFGFAGYELNSIK